MGETIASFFANLVSLSNPLWLYYPLCAVVAVVYKATKLDKPRAIALGALHFFVTVSLGMFALAAAFYLISKYL